MQNGRVESFNGRMREECLNVSWFGNLFEARGKIAAWRKEYNQERPHSSLGYRTPAEFAREVGGQDGCGKDGGFAPLENASRFPLSHSHGGDDLPPPSKSAIRMSYYDACGVGGQVTRVANPGEWLSDRGHPEA